MFRTRTHGLYRFLLGWGSGSDSRSKSARNMEHLPKFQPAAILYQAWLQSKVIPKKIVLAARQNVKADFHSAENVARSTFSAIAFF